MIAIKFRKTEHFFTEWQAIDKFLKITGTFGSIYPQLGSIKRWTERIKKGVKNFQIHRIKFTK